LALLAIEPVSGLSDLFSTSEVLPSFPCAPGPTPSAVFKPSSPPSTTSLGVSEKKHFIMIFCIYLHATTINRR